MLLSRKDSYEHKVAIVTGASSGIGKATAIEFARRGASVVIADVLEDGAFETAQEIERVGGKHLFVKCDVSKSADVKNLMNRAIKAFGKIDCAFNNAGIEGQLGNSAECTEANWDKVIDINLKGVWLCMKYELMQMMTQGNGSIVNCSSIAGLTGFEGLPAYVASKHGVVGLTEAAALEYAKSNIRINAVCPGVIRTAMVNRVTQGDQKAEEELIKNEPMGRMGSPEEIAESVIWLCSDAASFVTGQAIAIDGGWTAR